MEGINRWDSVRGFPHEVWDIEKTGLISTETIIDKTVLIGEETI